MQCRTCGGHGDICVRDDVAGAEEYATCPMCKGSGQLPSIISDAMINPCASAIAGWLPVHTNCGVLSQDATEEIAAIIRKFCS